MNILIYGVISTPRVPSVYIITYGVMSTPRVNNVYFLIDTRKRFSDVSIIISSFILRGVSLEVYFLINTLQTYFGVHIIFLEDAAYIEPNVFLFKRRVEKSVSKEYFIRPRWLGGWMVSHLHAKFLSPVLIPASSAPCT